MVQGGGWGGLLLINEDYFFNLNISLVAGTFPGTFVECVLLLLQAGFDPHPHMRAPGLPASLTSIPGGKP